MTRAVLDRAALIDGDARVSPIEREVVTLNVRGLPVEVRLTRVDGTWLASAPSIDGPTLGCDHSPYLAVSQAIAPLGGRLIDALGAMRLRQPARSSAAEG